MGGVVCWNDLIVGDGFIPEPLYVPPNHPVVIKGCFNTTYHQWSDDPEENWAALQPTLSVLEPVCPHVVEWVWERYHSGKIQWKEDIPGGPLYLATHNWIDGELCLYRRLYAQSDAEKACTLAHEWRHSRQNYSVLSRQILSIVFLNRNDETLVEDDADLYENKVRLAYYNQDVVTWMALRQWRATHGIRSGTNQRPVP